MQLKLISAGVSRSFPDGTEGLPTEHQAIVFIGEESGDRYRNTELTECDFVAVELGNECLGVHTGTEADDNHRRTVGFARFRMGRGAPTPLVEIVRQPWTDDEAVTSAQHFFEAAGLKTAVCADMPGRIVNRLIRPYLNAVLRRLDQRLATAGDMDATLRLGLGYPEGPNELLARTGLVDHFDTTQALHQALGDPDFAPARSAQIAKARS